MFFLDWKATLPQLAHLVSNGMSCSLDRIPSGSSPYFRGCLKHSTVVLGLVEFILTRYCAMQVVLCIRSLNGETQRFSPNMTLSDVRRQLEDSLPAFSEIKFFQGERELVKDEVVVEVELQAVACTSPGKALAKLDRHMLGLLNLDQSWHYTAVAQAERAGALLAANAIGEMGELPKGDNAKLMKQLFEYAEYGVQDTDLVEALGNAFGRTCGDPVLLMSSHLFPNASTDALAWDAFTDVLAWAYFVAYAALEGIAGRDEDALHAYAKDIAEALALTLKSLINRNGVFGIWAFTHKAEATFIRRVLALLCRFGTSTVP